MWWARVWKLNLAKLPASAVKRWKKCESPKSPTHWCGYFGNSLALSYDIKPPPQLVTSTLDTCVHIQKKLAHSFWCVQVPATSVLVIKLEATYLLMCYLSTRNTSTAMCADRAEAMQRCARNRGGAEFLGKGRAVDGTESGAGGKCQVPGGGLTSVCLKQINKQIIHWEGKKSLAILFFPCSWPLINNLSVLGDKSSSHVLHRPPGLTD